MSDDHSSDVSVTVGNSDEVGALVELWLELAEDQRRHGSHMLSEANRATIRETMLQHVMTETAIVARRNGSIVGFVTFEVENGRYQQDLSRGIIQNVYVQREHRNDGIGNRLLTAAETALERRGVDVISLEAMAANDRAIRFYRRHGYEDYRIELEKPINSDPQK